MKKLFFYILLKIFLRPTTTKKVSLFRNIYLAHRGFKEKSLENTKEAFVSAIKQGFCGVELDVQMSQDLVPVVFHDLNLKRLAGKNQKISDCRLSEIRSITLQKGKGQIEPLEDILSIFPLGCVVNVEIKETALINLKESITKILAAIKPFRNKIWIIISSFEAKILWEVKRQDPSLSLGFLVDYVGFPVVIFKNVKLLNDVDFINPHQELCSMGLIKSLAHKKNFILWGHKGQIPKKNHLPMILISDGNF